MLKPKLGRAEFLLYTVVLMGAEALLMLGAILATTGFHGLSSGQPGAGHEALALAVVLYLIPLTAARAAIAARRWNDAAGPRFVLWLYGLVLAAQALLLASACRTADGGPSHVSFGFGLLSFVSFVLWAIILLQRPAAGDALDGHYARLENDRWQPSGPVYTP